MTSRYVGCAKKARFQPYKVSFSPQRWNEKAWQLYRICGRMPLKSTLFCFGHPFFNILRLFSRRRERPAQALRQPAGHRDQQPGDQRGDNEIQRPVHAQRQATAHHRRRPYQQHGDRAPNADAATAARRPAAPSWRRTSCDPTGKQSLSLSASACVKTAECPAPAPAGHAPV